MNILEYFATFVNWSNPVVRSGYVHIGNGRLGVAGISGYGWSLRSYPETSHAYYLRFNASGVDPSTSYIRWFGLSIRCRAR